MADQVNTANILAQRYRLLNALGGGGMGLVYRVLDRLTGHVVALKRMSNAKTQYALDFQAAFAAEFRLLASIQHPNIVNVLDFGFDGSGQPFFTMEILENSQTISAAGYGQPLALQIELLAQLLRALGYLHYRGIVHRDLKPSNVLVTGNHVTVLDFGIALSDTHVNQIIGTPPYIAPEILGGKPGDTRADLYAVGAIAYEMFSGRYLFDAATPDGLTNAVLHEAPDLANLGLNEALSKVLLRLLAKRPEDRFQSAEQVIEALSEAIHQPIPTETPTLRESFLHSGNFIGRGPELAHLSNLLAQATENQGSAWLIAGESGVGKSRLLAEFRSLALVRGALVLRGHAILDTKLPYQLWRDPLREIAASVDITDAEASVFKTVVPDLELVLGQQIQDSPAQEPEIKQASVVSTLTEMMRRYKVPIVLILENINWASADDLAVLREINARIHDLPVLVLASYRDDDNLDFPVRLPSMQILKLNRLSPQGIADLAKALISSPEIRPELIDMLYRESEGNIFFLIESIRGLAEEAGSLGKISTLPLRSEILTGGVQRMIQRRLSRVPEEARAFLQTAALAGNYIDPTILRAMASFTDFDQWLIACTEAGVLTFQDEYWRFSHSKLQQAIIAELTPAEQRLIHEQIATTIESVFPDRSSHAPALAKHWGKAGNTDKEMQYSTLAGELALNNGAYVEALSFLTRALDLAEASHLPDASIRQASLKRLIANAYYGSGDLVQSREQLEQALVILGFPVPRNFPALILGLVKEGIVQAFHRILPLPFRHESEANWQGSRVYDRLGQIYSLLEKTPLLIYAALRQANLAEIDGAPEVLARAYASLSVALGHTALARFGERYARLAREIAEQTGDSSTLSWVLQLLGMWETRLGRWQEAEKDLERSAEIANKTGYRVRWQESAALLALVFAYQGKLPQAAKLRAAASASARREGDKFGLIWRLLSQTEISLMLGLIDEVFGLLDEAAPLVDEETPDFQKSQLLALQALSHIYLGMRDQARQKADAAMAIIRRTPVTPALHMLQTYANVTEVYLTLWEQDKKAGFSDTPGLEHATREAFAVLNSASRTIPIGQPVVWLMQGWLDWLSGDDVAAKRAWQHSAILANQLSMPYLRAMADYKLGSCLKDSVAQQHLETARDSFAQLGALYYAAQSKIALRTRKIF